MNRTVGSFSGIKEDEGICLCFFVLKKSIYALIKSCRDFIFIGLEIMVDIKIYVLRELDKIILVVY